MQIRGAGNDMRNEGMGIGRVDVDGVVKLCGLWMETLWGPI